MKVVLAFLLLCVTLFAKDDYELGEGYQVGEMPIYIGGYFSLDYRKKDEQDRYRIDDIALMSYGGSDTISYMLELESKELYVKTKDDNISKTKHNNKLYVERLYVDYTIDDNYKIRMGKFNSPIGFWNLMPINVLRATTSSPILGEMIYPKFTTGANLERSSFEDGALHVDIMLQKNTGIDDDEYNNYDIDTHYGLGLSYEVDNYIFKLNGGFFSKKHDELGGQDFSYALISAKYEDEKYEFLAELATQRSNKHDYNHAGYIQGLYRFTPKHIGTIRLESATKDLDNYDDDIAIFAYTYRPLYPVALKTEYQQHSKENENQFLISISVLF